MLVSTCTQPALRVERLPPTCHSRGLVRPPGAMPPLACRLLPGFDSPRLPPRPPVAGHRRTPQGSARSPELHEREIDRRVCRSIMVGLLPIDPKASRTL